MSDQSPVPSQGKSLVDEEALLKLLPLARIAHPALRHNDDETFIALRDLLTRSYDVQILTALNGLQKTLIDSVHESMPFMLHQLVERKKHRNNLSDMMTIAENAANKLEWPIDELDKRSVN